MNTESIYSTDIYIRMGQPTVVFGDDTSLTEVDI